MAAKFIILTLSSTGGQVLVNRKEIEHAYFREVGHTRLFLKRKSMFDVVETPHEIWEALR
ncbi:hypothetical protein UFOVP347_19 [uncultured Caudovirales phage]|uniref:Uncharacterized protein n=1 Tax=uncultured Caudovirales phage TaxID=2100421 RepID=A0A6J5M6B9_9CAUD|nr:hypothetical protein UFOVP347_19 [uncultured Caudovirales phage]